MFTKEKLISELKKIRSLGWIKNARPGNAGGIGNTLEDLLGIEENNLPIPNASEWELKCQKVEGASLTTLFHMEPSPRALRFVPKILLPNYGWPHQEIPGEMSFRQTITGSRYTDRGFTIGVDDANRKVIVSFSSAKVSDKHRDWLFSVERRIGLGEVNPQPYWGFVDLMHKAGTKLLNCFYIAAETKNEEGVESFRYCQIMILQGFSFDKFLEQLRDGNILVDFDARTGHNHGTKFRMRQGALKHLYSRAVEF